MSVSELNAKSGLNQNTSSPLLEKEKSAWGKLGSLWKSISSLSSSFSSRASSQSSDSPPSASMNISTLSSSSVPEEMVNKTSSVKKRHRDDASSLNLEVSNSNNSDPKKSKTSLFQSLLTANESMPHVSDSSSSSATSQSSSTSNESESPLFSSSSMQKKLESKVKEKLKKKKKASSFQQMSESSSKSSPSNSSSSVSSSSDSSSSSESKVQTIVKESHSIIVDDFEEDFRFNPDDVWGTGSQYKDPRGKVICAAATAHCLIAMAKQEKIDSVKIDSFVSNGIQSYKTIKGFSDDEWNGDLKLLSAKLKPLDWENYFQDPSIHAQLKPKDSYFVKAPVPQLNPESGLMPSFSPIDQEDFFAVFGPLIEVVRSNKGQPVVAALVIGNYGLAVSETYGLCIQEVKGVMTYQLFNSHGTDIERNSESGVDGYPARLNCFIRNNFQGTSELQFRTYFANRLGAVVKDDRAQIDINLCELNHSSE